MILLLIFSSIFSLMKINPEKPSRNGLIKYCIVHGMISEGNFTNCSFNFYFK